MATQTHEGVYGIISSAETTFSPNTVLLIEKKRGPYTGKLDLIGGTIEDESYEECLRREIREEIGAEVKTAEGPYEVDFTIPYMGGLFRHIAHIYRVSLVEPRPIDHIELDNAEVGSTAVVDGRVIARDQNYSMFSTLVIETAKRYPQFFDDSMKN